MTRPSTRSNSEIAEVSTVGAAGAYGDLSGPEMMVGVAWGDEFGEAVRAEGAL